MGRDEKPTRIKVSFEITEIVNKEIQELVKELGYNDRAEFIRDAIREKIAVSKKERSLRQDKGSNDR